MEAVRYPELLVFGLDIGTRSIVGTVGYKEAYGSFRVVAQVTRLHETRAMIDGQIHDIRKVAETISGVKKELEEKIGRRLQDVCIAAAGRVLKTVTVRADHEFADETVIDDEHIHTLELLAVEKAYDILREGGEAREAGQDAEQFYCVAYTAVRYFLNDYAMSNLEGHKGVKIGAELLVTFLPEEVVDGLYAAVEKAGLYVANLTLEPIAAMNLAIPESYRLLNIALVDVGAGTSDISITRDGSITAFGMIPYAGDEITEVIAKKYLTDFDGAEKIKMACLKKKAIAYKDIMGIRHRISPEEVLDTASDTVELITQSVADKIVELNGGKTVSAVFVVGGGGKLPGFTQSLAAFLKLPEERVALRGAEVMQEVVFSEAGVKKDSLLVTPVGICLNFYEQRNRFIFVTVNGERVKLYDNNKLTIVDAAVQAGIANEVLFPQRGKPLTFTVNGEKRLVRGEMGEAALIRLNSREAGINTSIEQNDRIEITASTVGNDAGMEIQELPEYSGTIAFRFNGTKILCPKFAEANKNLVSGFYSIQDGDEIKILNYYTLAQILAFMDVKYTGSVFVNHVPAGMDELVYENFSVDCEIPETLGEEPAWPAEAVRDHEEPAEKAPPETEPAQTAGETVSLHIFVNGTPVTLKNKASYLLVDVLDFYPLDLNPGKEKKLVTEVNGIRVNFSHKMQGGDMVRLYWEE